MATHLAMGHVIQFVFDPLGIILPSTEGKGALAAANLLHKMLDLHLLRSTRRFLIKDLFGKFYLNSHFDK